MSELQLTHGWAALVCRSQIRPISYLWTHKKDNHPWLGSIAKEENIMQDTSVKHVNYGPDLDHWSGSTGPWSFSLRLPAMKESVLDVGPCLQVPSMALFGTAARVTLSAASAKELMLSLLRYRSYQSFLGECWAVEAALTSSFLAVTMRSR